MCVLEIFSKIFKLIFSHSGQLQLTYKQEDSPEDPNLPTEEPEASPSDNLSITPVETAPPPPPAPAPAPEIHLDTGDLLVYMY